jgi:hypothetical protein
MIALRPGRLSPTPLPIEKKVCVAVLKIAGVPLVFLHRTKYERFSLVALAAVTVVSLPPLFIV